MNDAEQVPKPTIEVVHKDITLGNTYRIELDKLLLTLAVALFAFSTSFVPTLSAIVASGWMAVGWGCLAASISGGILELLGWEMFYISYRDYDYRGKPEEGKRVRRIITLWRRVGRTAQILGFIAGVAAISYFYGLNFKNIRLGS
jgi:hypothetical protein